MQNYLFKKNFFKLRNRIALYFSAEGRNELKLARRSNLSLSAYRNIKTILNGTSEESNN